MYFGAHTVQWATGALACHHFMSSQIRPFQIIYCHLPGPSEDYPEPAGLSAAPAAPVAPVISEARADHGAVLARAINQHARVEMDDDAG